MSRKKNKRPNFDFLHYVDDEHKIVYFNKQSMMGNWGASVQLAKEFPGYKIQIASIDLIEHLNGEY